MTAYEMATLADRQGRPLSPRARLLLPVLKRFAKGNRECWSAALTLGRAIGYSARSIQLALKELQELGLVQVVRDYALKTRRRIVLLFLGPEPGESQPAPAPNSLGAKNAPDSARPIAPSPALPPDPPIEVSEDGMMKRNADGPGASASGRNPRPSRTQEGDQEEDGTLDRAASRAEEAFGPGAGGRARRLAQEFPPAWIGRALDEAGKARRRGKEVTWGYVVAALRNWRAEGGPSPGPLAATKPSEARPVEYFRPSPDPRRPVMRSTLAVRPRTVAS